MKSLSGLIMMDGLTDMYSRTRRKGETGHSMGMGFMAYLIKLTNGGLVRESDSYEMDRRIEKKYHSSGRTKKQCSTRRSFDNSAATRALHSVVKKIAWDLNHGECKTLTGKVKELAIREYMDRELIKSNKKLV